MSDLKLFNEKRILELSKKDITEVAKSMVSELDEGEKDSTTTFIAINKFSNLCKELEKNIRKIVVRDIKIGDKEVYKAHGVEIQRADTGVSYDYSSCGSSEWDELNGKIKELTERKKKVESFLRGLEKPVADPETGEVINPPKRTATEKVKLTIK